jgi:arabinogalactan endo-1,4-beta-galactosidase
MANVNDSHPVSNHEAFYQNMATYNVDYDIVGLSYYPYYHGDTDNLESAIRVIENKFPTKKIMIVETGYFHKYYPNDAKYDWRTLWPDTDAGQQLYATTIVGILNNHSSVTGLFWWFPEANEYMLNWNTQRVTDGWYNASLWDNETGKVLPAINELKGFK